MSYLIHLLLVFQQIKRPYFHVKPLDLKQLNNWREYLDFELEVGDHERIVVLFERCLIACAHYEEFWCRYARYDFFFSKPKVLVFIARLRPDWGP